MGSKPRTAYETLFPTISREFWEKQEESRQRREERWREIERNSPGIAIFRNLTTRAVASDKAAKDSFAKLLSSGFDEPELLEVLVGLATVSRRKSGKNNWLSKTRLTPRQLDYFPKRVRDIAAQIEILNKDPFFSPEWVTTRGLSQSGKKIFAIWFVRLPVLLQAYAAFLEAHFRDTSRFMAKRSSERTKILKRLLVGIREKTGRPMYSMLSNVLMATAQVAGTPSKGLDPESLKTLDSNHRRTVSATKKAKSDR